MASSSSSVSAVRAFRAAVRHARRHAPAGTAATMQRQVRQLAADVRSGSPADLQLLLEYSELQRSIVAQRVRGLCA